MRKKRVKKYFISQKIGSLMTPKNHIQAKVKIIQRI